MTRLVLDEARYSEAGLRTAAARTTASVAGILLDAGIDVDFVLRNCGPDVRGLPTDFRNRIGADDLRVLAARRTADWFIAHLPPDAVPYWDFRDPTIPRTERDASSAAIAASALYDLARRADADDGARYRTAADRMLASLASNYLAPSSPRGAILAHSTGGHPQKSEIDVGLVYADYFYVEALLRRKGLFLE